MMLRHGHGALLPKLPETIIAASLAVVTRNIANLKEVLSCAVCTAFLRSS